MSPITISAIANSSGFTVKDYLADPLVFKLARNTEDDSLASLPSNFLVINTAEDIRNLTTQTSTSLKDSEPASKQVKTESSSSKSTAENDSEIRDGYIEPKPPLFPRGKLALTWTRSYQNPPGMYNFGVTCYMNSVLQALLHIPAMVQYLLQIHRGECNLSTFITTKREYVF